MTYNCPLCPKIYEKAAWLLKHIRSSHRNNIVNKLHYIEKIKLKSFAEKIETVPKRFVVPAEYAGSFAAVD